MPIPHPGDFHFHPEFRPEFSVLDPSVKKELAATILAIRNAGGPTVGRPTVDTLNGSRYPNMKEIRFDNETEVWRFAFAYTPTRDAVVLCGGDKQGTSEKAFYKALVAKADRRYGKWLKNVKAATEKASKVEAGKLKQVMKKPKGN